MKKVICFILVIIISLILYGCADRKVQSNVVQEQERLLSQEEMLKIAKDVTIGALLNETAQNLAKAKQDYAEKYIKLTGFLIDINEDHAIIRTPKYSSYAVKVFLPLETLVSLEEKTLLISFLNFLGISA